MVIQVFNETNLPKRFPIGTKGAVVSFSQNDLREFYDKHYHPSNMCLLIVGDVDPQGLNLNPESEMC
jgi:zinc protease